MINPAGVSSSAHKVQIGIKSTHFKFEISPVHMSTDASRVLDSSSLTATPEQCRSLVTGLNATELSAAQLLAIVSKDHKIETMRGDLPRTLDILDDISSGGSDQVLSPAQVLAALSAGAREVEKMLNNPTLQGSHPALSEIISFDPHAHSSKDDPLDLE